jgi:hypothetical protein
MSMAGVVNVRVHLSHTLGHQIGARWDVPVHVIASRPEILDALRVRGFRSGLTPVRPSLGKMHTLLPTLLDAFSSR